MPTMVQLQVKGVEESGFFRILLEAGMRPSGVNTAQGIGSMIEGLGARRLTLCLFSDLNQPVVIHPGGSQSNTPTNVQNLHNVGKPITLVLGSTAQTISSIIFNMEEMWHPFLGIVIVTTATAPTTGLLKVMAIGEYR